MSLDITIQIWYHISIIKLYEKTIKIKRGNLPNLWE